MKNRLPRHDSACSCLFLAFAQSASEKELLKPEKERFKPELSKPEKELEIGDPEIGRLVELIAIRVVEMLKKQGIGK
jgi:hypothetical protein